MSRQYLIISLIIWIVCNSVSAREEIAVPVDRDIYRYAKNILNNRNIEDITPDIFSHPLCQRDVVDLLLIQKALHIGKAQVSLKFFMIDHEEREEILLQSGMSVISVDTLWYSSTQELSDDVYISSPIIRNGEYFAGVYAASERVVELGRIIDSDFSKVTVISNKDWAVDWSTIQLLSPKQLFNETDWTIMARLVSNGWVDIMLIPFNNQTPFKYTGKGYSVEAIQGIKVALQDSRHFVVSKKHQHSQAIFNALEVGIKQLRASKFIENSYRNCGFLNVLVDKWREIP
ncbi:MULTISPECIES: hypothetical protein [Pseudoalteromonas]|uniref:Solute-binding protein family 3/N-terminal domain-containing protein n=1 Tax=Pseudoalteromonas luteoviolacea (strain 2ta16) TaxID=1353533 RepID=V4HKU0_PSEL2|nr:MULTISPECIES: hypothetical protein [Pseudoalteromonas]ESP90363.1 hypothetical protein PL2TA16_01931 [Pseudoalteromonas luteoviolacea 2ta16]KZN40535.1 hypothetical protein N483_17395 [Pseudoalteromonas luteoviolacea NCIMB 1944]MCG7546936.1 hypothetical protein [Pseudoalteromonas sp. Of7M-16]